MTAIEAIMKRRSIRKFTDMPVAREKVMEIIYAAAAAPSAMNLRPVRLILMEKQDMTKLAETIEQKAPFIEGQWAIAVCANTRGYTGGIGWLEDCAAALENILIAAVALDLGALWYGVYNRPAKEPQVRAALNLPDGTECAGIAVIGHPAEKKEEHGKAKPEYIFMSKWE